MKRKNLEKAIVLSLMLSCVYSTVWAEHPKGDIIDEGNGVVSFKYSNIGEAPEPIESQGEHSNNWHDVAGVDNAINNGTLSLGTDGKYHIKDVDIQANAIFQNISDYGPYAITPLTITNDSGNIFSIDGDLNIIVKANVGENFDGSGTLNGLYVQGETVYVNGNVFLSAIAPGEGSITSNVIEINVPKAGLGSTNYDGKIFINNNNSMDKNINILGNLKIENEFFGDSDNTLEMNMSNADSYWYGIVNSGQSDVTIGLSNGAKWVPVDYDSNRKITDVVNGSVGTLNLNEGGIVDISKYNMDDAPEEAIVEGVATGADRTAATNHKVSVTNLNGSNGLFKMDLNYLDENGAVYTGNKGNNTVSDYLDIQTGGEGTQYIDFNAKDANIDKMNVGDKIYFANVASGDTQFDSTQHVYSSAANINNYEYGVESEAGSGTDWYVTLNNKTPDGNGNFEAAKGAMYAGYALGTELDRLNKRMGEARYLEDEKGVWVRYRHAKTGWDDTFETSSDMFQLGYDKEVQEDDGKHYRGIALDYTDADTTLDNVSGDGEHERYAVSLYDTWLGEKGHYRDLVIRGGRINSDYDLRGMFNDGMYDIGGDYHQWFGSISAEWGRKNDMNDGWYFEPQTQLQLARVGGASYVSDSGIAVDQDGATSLIGRVGFRLGREYAKADGTKHDNYYIKADLLHEFMGDKGIALTGADGRYEHEYDGQETWFDVGLGADISIDKDTYFWVDVEKTLGSDFDNTWQVNGGFRWEF